MVVLEPASTRPLTLGFTSCKPVAKFENVALFEAVAGILSRSQFVFMAGRLPSDAVLQVERHGWPLDVGGHHCRHLALGSEGSDSVVEACLHSVVAAPGRPLGLSPQRC